MQEVPVVAVQVVAVAGMDPVEAMHRVMVKAVHVPVVTEADATAVNAANDAARIKPRIYALTGSDTSIVRAARTADGANTTQSTDVSAAAEASAHTTRVAAAAAESTTAAARLCLRRNQARCQQCHRQIVIACLIIFSIVVERCATLEGSATPKIPMSQR
jgi:hypothetical protein